MKKLKKHSPKKKNLDLETLKERLKVESLLVRENSIKVLREFELF